MSIKITLGFCFAILFQLNIVLCASVPVSIPSAVGSASPAENHLGSSYGNNAPNSFGQKFGGFDPNHQQLIQNPNYGFQRPIYFPLPFNGPQSFQMPMNFYENEKGMFYPNPAYRPFNGAPAAGIGPYQYSSQQQYPIGLQSPPNQGQSVSSNLSPFSRSSFSQRKSDDSDKKPLH